MVRSDVLVGAGLVPAERKGTVCFFPAWLTFVLLKLAAPERK